MSKSKAKKVSEWLHYDQTTFDGLRSIDRLIAKRLGLEVYYEPDNMAFTDQRDWTDSYTIEREPQYRCSEVRFYTQEVNASIELLALIPEGSLRKFGENWQVIYMKPGNDMDDPWKRVYAKTPALAICKAFLEYGDSKETS